MRIIAFCFLTTFLLLISLAAPILAAPAPKTASDFAILPDYCKVRINQSKYPAKYTKWRKAFGKGWSDMHHYCKGLLYLYKGKYTAIESQQTISSFLEAIKQFTGRLFLKQRKKQNLIPRNFRQKESFHLTQEY